MTANTAIMEIAAVSGQDAYMTPLAIVGEQTDFSQEDLYNPFTAEYLPSIKFAHSESDISINGSVDFGKSCSVDLDKSGADIAYGLTLVFTLPAITVHATGIAAGQKVKWCDNIGHNFMSSTWINVGGTTMEKHTPMWFDIWSDIKLKHAGQRRLYNDFIGQQNARIIRIGTSSITNSEAVLKADVLVAAKGYTTVAGVATAGTLYYATLAAATTYVDATLAVTPTAADSATGVYSPSTNAYAETEGYIHYGYNGLQTYKTTHAATAVHMRYKFWWCDCPYLALPLVAFSLQTVEVKTEFRAIDALICYKSPSDATTHGSTYQIVNGSTLTVTGAKFYQTCVFVDDQTRDELTDLTTQIMVPLVDCLPAFSINRSITQSVKLNTSHPSDELIFVIQDARSVRQWYNQYTNFYKYNADGVTQAQPLVSAKLLFQNNDRTYDRTYHYFREELFIRHHEDGPTNYNVYCFPFSLEPEAYQIMGTANFSRIDNVNLYLSLDSDYSTYDASLYVFNRHRNFIRIITGAMGKLFNN